MASVQRLKANLSKSSFAEYDGAIASTGSLIDASGATSGTNTLALPADGNGGVTIGSTMTVSPETTEEDGFLTITVAGVSYQIPIYAA